MPRSETDSDLHLWGDYDTIPQMIWEELADSPLSSPSMTQKSSSTQSTSLILPLTSPSARFRVLQEVFGDNTLRTPSTIFDDLALTTPPSRTQDSPPQKKKPRLSLRGSSEDSIVLPAHTIAHSQTVQAKMDRRRISWGAQYEIARGVTHGRWGWDDVTASILDELQGSNSEAAPKVSRILGQSHKTSLDPSIWKELDREQLALIEGLTRGVGLYDGDWHGEENWYGGRVVQIARLDQDFKIKLEALEYQRATTRFARFLGSRRIIRLNVPPELLYRNEKLHDFLTQKFILCGRVFVPLRPKDGKVYLVEINENHERSPEDSEGDQLRLSFHEIVSWHNPMEGNSEQPIQKWVCRFDLGLSVSVPVLKFEQSQIIYIEDEHAPAHGKVSPEQILTDGCGFMNRTALSAIAKRMKYERIPTAVQGRIAGAKGVWMLHPEHQSDLSEVPIIWIRASQHKIHHSPDKLTRAHLIFDLVAPDRVSFPSRLSAQTIMNMSHNGVPDTIFKELMSAGLNEDFRKLTTWQGEGSMKVVLHTVAKVGSVSLIRLRREAAGLARVLGHGREKSSDEAYELSPDDDDDSDPGRSPFSGEPRLMGEKIFELIAAGFHPLSSKTLFKDLKQMVKNMIENYTKSFHITNPQSCEAFIVPDPFGVLKENEIYFRSWQCLRDPQTECNPEVLSGLVLMNRNPTRLPSDIQLVMAIDDHHQLFQNYRNVILCSIKGKCSLASKLAGGDYDGDTAMVTWSPAIVDAFKCPSLNDPPLGFMENNFEKDVETVERFRERISTISDPIEAAKAFHHVFILGLSNSRIGQYSKFHDNSVYKNGYDHEDTVRLAFMFNTILDSSKSGLKVKPDVFTQDNSQYNRPLPECMPKSEKNVSDNSIAFKRRADLPAFVLEALSEHGRMIGKELLSRYEHLEGSIRPDNEILCDFVKAKDVPSLHSELEQIKAHVNQLHIEWTRCIGKAKKSVNSTSKGTKRDVEAELNKVRERFASNPVGTKGLQSLGIIDKMKASYAYSKGEVFAFSVGYQDILLIKAMANRSTPVTRSMANILAVSPAIARMIERETGG